MGNLTTKQQQKSYTTFKDSFKTFQKEGIAEDAAQPTVSTEFLLGEEKSLIDGLAQYLYKAMGVEVSDEDVVGLLSTNVQKNVDVEEVNLFHGQKALAQANAGFVCGFKNAESNIEDLGSPDYEKHFSVLADQEQYESYHKIQVQKMKILYGLYIYKQKSSSGNCKSFQDYAKQFLKEADDENDSEIFGYQASVGFIVGLMRELKGHNDGSLLTKTLEHLLQALHKVKPGSFHANTKYSFERDATLNKARDFLLELIRDSKTDKAIQLLALRVILMLGLARQSVEDALILCQLLQEKVLPDVDLRKELKVLRDSDTQNFDSSAADVQFDAGSIQFVSDHFIEMPMSSYGDGSIDVSLESDSWVLDGAYMYAKASGKGLLKLSTGTDGKTPGKIVAANKDLNGDRSSMMLLNGKIYLRHTDAKPAPFEIIDAETLKVIKSEPEVNYDPKEGQIQSLKWLAKDPKTGRSLEYTPLITDGNMVYVISKLGLTEEQEEEQKDAEEPDNTPKLVLEVYDPSNAFKFVKQVTLCKKNKAPFKKSGNSDEWLRKAKWATNGQVIACFTDDSKIRFFSIETGHMVSKQVCDDYAAEDLIMSDPVTTQFAQILKSDGILQYRKFIFENFKAKVSQAKKSDGLDELQKKFLADVDPKGEGEQSFNVIESLMMVDSAQHESNQLKAGAWPEDIKPSQIPGLTRAFILQFLSSKVQNFKLALESAEQQSKSALGVMSLFRYPLVTYLTPRTFIALGKALKAGADLFESELNKDNSYELQSLLSLLELVNANFRALNFCSISLSSMLPKDQDHYEFMAAFKACVKPLAQEGAELSATQRTHEPSKIRAKYELSTAEQKKVFVQLYEASASIMESSITLLHKDPKDILSSTNRALAEGGGQKCKVQIADLAQIQQMRILMELKKQAEHPENEKQMAEIIEAFRGIVKLDSTMLKDKLNGYDIDKINDFKETIQEKDRALLAASQEFITNFCEEIALKYSAKCQNVPKKKSAKYEAYTQELAILEKAAETVVEVSFTEIQAYFDIILDTLLKSCEAKKEDSDWEGYEEKFKTYQSLVVRAMSEQSALRRVFMLYTQTFSLLRPQGKTLIVKITKGAVSLVRSMSYFYTIWKKYGTKLGLGAEIKDYDASQQLNTNFETMIGQVRRHLNWYVGHVAYELMKIEKKKPEEEKKEEDKKEEEKEEMDTEKEQLEKRQKEILKMVLQSNLLSGGIEPQNLKIFQTEAKNTMLNYAKLIGDQTLIGCFDSSQSEAKDAPGSNYTKLEAIITEGKDPEIDLVIKLLQKLNERAQMGISRIGGPMGLKLNRAAFAIMIKFSDLSEDLFKIVEELQMLSEMEEDGPQKDQVLIKALKEIKNADLIIERWQSAARMRQWLQQKRKNLAEKIEKRLEKKLRKKKLEEAKEKAAELKKKEEEDAKTKKTTTSEKKKDEPAKEGQTQIDSSTKPSEDDETKKAASAPVTEEPEESSEFTPKEMSKIQDDAFEIMEKELEITFNKIINKAGFLVKLNIPQGFKQQDPMSKEQGSLLLIRAPSQTKDLPKPKLDWEGRLKTWKLMQTSQGSIKSMDEIKSDVWNSGITSILALLQAAVDVEPIQKQVEEFQINSCKRATGLKLLSDLMAVDMPKSHFYDLIGWFCSSLRSNKNTLTHYLDDTMGGQGTHFEILSRTSFFEIYGTMIKHLQVSKDDKEIKIILNALKWKFSGRDHGELAQLKVFGVLHKGNGEKDNKLKKSWGRPIVSECKSIDDQSVATDVLEMFEHLFLAASGRISAKEDQDTMKFKGGSSGDTLKLQRAKSLLDQSMSEVLLAQAFEIIFKELERYLKMMSKFKGVDWSVYVQMRNQERKKGDSPKKLENPDDLLLDEIEEEKEEKKEEEKKEETKEETKVEEEAKKEDAKVDVEEVKVEIEEQQIPSSSPPAQQAAENVCGVCTFINPAGATECEMCGSECSPPEVAQASQAPQPSKDEEEDDEESDKGNDEAQKDMKEFIDKRKALEEREFKNLGQLYSESFLRRLLRLVEIFTSIAKCSSNPLSMVQRIANPYHLSTLLNLLIISTPSIKIIMLKILQNIIQISIPHEVFEEAVRITTRDKNSLGYSIVHETKTKSNFEESLFVKFLFNYLLSVRSKMWSNQDAESEGQYSVSQTIAETLRVMSSLCGGQKAEPSSHQKGQIWNKVMTQNITEQLLQLEELPLDEADALFSVLGGEYGRLTAGQKAITSNDEIVTILGYSSTWKTPELIFGASKEKDEYEKILKQLDIQPEFTDPKQMAIGLFYDKNQKERQDFMLLNPSSLTPVMGVDEEEDSRMAEKSPLMNAALIKNFIKILKIKDEEIKKMPITKQVATSQNQSYILKVLNNQIQVMGQKFLDYLKKENCLDELIDYLYQDISKISSQKTKSKEQVIPLKWLEAKIYHMRKLAIETSRSLSFKNEDTKVFLMDKKELVFKRVDLSSKITTRTNAFITSAVNIHTVAADAIYPCIDASEIGVERSTCKVIKNQLVTMDINDLKTLNEKALTILNTSDAIVTAQPESLDVSKLFKELFTIYMKDQEKSPKCKYENILTPAIFFVSEEDYARCVKPAASFKKAESQSGKDPIQRLLDDLHEWGGLDSEELLFNLKKENLNDLPAVLAKMEEGLTQLMESEEKYQEEVATLKKNKEDGALTKLKEKEDQKKSTRAEQAKEISAALKDLIKNKDEEEQQKSSLAEVNENIEVFEEYIKDEKWWKEIKEVIEKKISTKGSSKEQKAKADEKNDEKMNKQLYTVMTSYDTKNLRQEHAKFIGQSLQQQRKECLFEIISKSNVSSQDGILKSLMATDESKNRFAQFLKLKFNSTICEMLQNGQKKDYQTMKQKIKDIFEYCKQSDELKGFIRSFLVNHILKAGVESAKDFKEQKTKKVTDYFSFEDKAISGLNPYILRFFTIFLMKDNFSDVLDIKNTLPTLLNLTLANVMQFQETKPLVNKLMKSCLKIVIFARKNCGALAKTDQLAPLVQNKLIKLVTEKVDFTDQSEKDNKWFTTQQLVFLEIHLHLNELADQTMRMHKIKIDKILVDSEAISRLNMTKQILRENDKFESLKYLYHLDHIEDHQKALMNLNIESNHPAFDVMTRAFISIPEVKRLKIKFKEAMKLKDMSQIGFSNDSKSEIILKNQNSKEFDWQSGNFYMFYPITLQSLVGFGDNEGQRLGDKKNTFTLPAISAPEAGDSFRPERIYGAGHHSAVVTSTGDLYETGYLRESSDKKLTTLTKDTALKEKVRLVALSQETSHVVLEDNKVFYKGYSAEHHLPKNEDKTTFTELKIWKDEKDSEKIVNLTSGYGYTLATTEKGNLWAWGELFLKAIDFKSQVPLQITLPEGTLCRRTWASRYADQTVAFLELEDKDGKKHIYTAGKSKEGLLGQGAKASDIKQFKKMTYEDGVEFTDLSVGDNFVMAIDSTGKLWGWGVNKNNALGFKEIDDQGIQQPTLLTGLNDLGMIAKKISCGPNHSLILFEDKKVASFGKEFLYSVGLTKGKDFAHLGAPEDQTKDAEKPFREIKEFNEKKLVSFLAHDTASLVIIEGKKEIYEGLYAHTLPDKRQVQGLLHFYKSGDEWKFVTPDEYESKKNDLPDLCFAIKCPIEDIAGKEWPDLEKLASEVIDAADKSSEIVHTGFKCSKNGNEVKGPLYHSRCIVNHGEIEANFSESTINIDTEHAINPLIFIRVAKKMKSDAKLPSFSLENFYKSDSKAGIDMEIIPDLKFQKNSKLLKLTKDQWDEIQDNDSKFKLEWKKLLLEQIDKQISLLMKDKKPKDIKIETEIKIGEFEYKDKDPFAKSFKKLNEKAKKQKVFLYWMLNQEFFKILPYNSNQLSRIPGSVLQLVQIVKGSLLGSMKTKFINDEIKALSRGSRGHLKIMRLKAQRFKDKGKCDHTGEHTMFGQLFQYFKKEASRKECFRQNETDEKAFTVDFPGEGSMDDNGPYRECLSNLVEELEGEFLPLFIKTPNNRNTHGFNRNCVMPNPSSTNPTHAGMFYHMGLIMGYALRTKSALDWNLPPYFWKQLLGEPATISDLEGLDFYSYQVLRDISVAGESKDIKHFDSKVDEVFTTYLGNGKLVELCTDGKNKKVTHANHKEFIDLVTKVKLAQTDKQMGWIKDGINFVVDLNILTFLTWEELEIRACGPKLIDLEVLKKITTYNVDKDHPMIVMYWEVMATYSQEELKRYLKFVWGRTKIPVDTSNMRDYHRVKVYTHLAKDSLPIAHTCYFTIDIPTYSSKDIMTKRIRTAFDFCGEIDGDYSANHIPREDGGGGYGSEE